VYAVAPKDLDSFLRPNLRNYSKSFEKCGLTVTELVAGCSNPPLTVAVFVRDSAAVGATLAETVIGPSVSPTKVRTSMQVSV
jgi:hypothetical protein